MYVLSKVPTIALQNQIILKSVLRYINADKANIIFITIAITKPRNDYTII
jgi:hypothetical protein